MRAAPFLAVLLVAAFAGTVAFAEDAPKKKAKAPEHKQTQSKSFVDLDPIYTTIVTDNKAGGMLMLRIGLDVPDEALHAEIDHSLPVLRDAYIRNMMSFTANMVRTDTQPDVTVIADRLQGITDRALKRRGARVLLSQVAIRVTR